MTALRSKPTKPGTHALVIGIGRYPWLVGGKGKPRFAQNDGMAQLTSPPASARAFATWLLETYDNPKAQLASLDLLLSDVKDQKFKAGNKAVEVESANFANVSQAIKAWAGRSKKAEDILIFFFSGHGIAAGNQTTLLCEDFGSERLSPLGHAIDFTKLRIGLDKVTARRQCFFVDACRVGTQTILDTFQFYGQPVIDPSAAHSPNARQAPVFNSTLEGQSAFGPKGKPSYFTQAILRALEGPGSDKNLDGLTWWVQPDQLLRALPQLLRRVARDPDDISLQAPGDYISNFPFHRLKQRPTRIPVDVSCNPEIRTAKAILSCNGEGQILRRKVPSTDVWRLDLDEGRYTFQADIATPKARGLKEGEPIGPHYCRVRIPV